MATTVKVEPSNTSSILAKINKVDLSGGTPPKRKVVDDGSAAPRDRRTHEGAEVRKKNKELRDKLTSTETSLEEKGRLLDELQSELEQVRAENATLKPIADQWSKYEGVERAKLLKKLAPEYIDKDVKEMPLPILSRYAQGLTGKGASGAAAAGNTGGKKDWAKIMERNDPAEMEKAIKEDEEGFNKFMDSVNQ